MEYYVSMINEHGSIAVDDTILIKDLPLSAGSKILEGFKPLFSAEAVERLIKAGYEIAGKSAVGEFGLDLLGEFGTGGASLRDGKLCMASSELVAAGSVKAALSVDLNGAPRRGAAMAGTDFIKPTYGTVSRYGIVPCACSGEQIGVGAKNASDIKEILTVIRGHDPKDGTSLRESDYPAAYKNDGEKITKVCIFKEMYEAASEEVRAYLDAYKERLMAAGIEVQELTFGFFEEAAAAWQILMCAETCNNLSRYDGVKFGYRSSDYKNIDELYVNTRSEGLNYLTKSIILYGSDVLSKNRYSSCYDTALKARRVICERFKEITEEYGAVFAPACGYDSYDPYDISNAPLKVYEESRFSCIPNLTGVPALVSGGVQLMGPAFSDMSLLDLAILMEEAK